MQIAGPHPGGTITANLSSEPDQSPLPGVPEKEFADLCAKIIIMVPHRPTEGVDESVTIANGAWARWGMHTGFPPDEFAGNIAFTRAGMVKQFLDICRETDESPFRLHLPKFKFLVMIDNDELVHPLAPIQLAFNDKPVTTGVVCSPSEHGIVRANFTLKDDFGLEHFPSVKYTRHIPARGIKEVNGCGAGLICIRRDVLESIVAAGRIPFVMNAEEHAELVSQFWATGRIKLGEDFQFSRQAREAGFSIFVDFSVMAGHRKQTVVIWPKALIDPNLDASTWHVDMRDVPHG